MCTWLEVEIYFNEKFATELELFHRLFKISDLVEHS